MTSDLVVEPSFLRRLWIYQAERFPLLKHGLLIAVFSSAILSATASLAGLPLPSLSAFSVAFVTCLLIFFVLRVADECKDAEIDRRYRPERPVPRGLISLRTLVGFGALTVAISVLIVAIFQRPAWPFLMLVWAWVGLMSFEFFVPSWLNRRPAVYLVSHMLVMPLIVVFVASHVLVLGLNQIPASIIGLLVLSFANGCILEIGRKLWAPSQERNGVDSYSKLWGTTAGGAVWAGTLLIALIAAIWLLTLLAPSWIAPLVLGITALCAQIVVWRFVIRPTTRNQRHLEAVSGIWTLVSYGALGIVAVIGQGGTL